MNLAELKKEAKSKKTSSARLEELARHADISIQLTVANNLNASAATLEYLSDHHDLYVLKAVAKNRNTSPSILLKLAKDDRESVRLAIIGFRDNLGEEIGRILVNDSSAKVRAADYVGLARVAMRHDLPDEWLERLAGHPHFSVRTAIAKNPSTPQEVLLNLLEDTHQQVIHNLAKNRSSPTELLASLVEQNDPFLAMMLISNPNLTDEQRVQVMAVMFRSPGST